MRLQSQISREYKDKEGNDKQYEKFWIVIPSKVIKKLGWKARTELEAEIKDGKLVIEKD